MSFLAIASFIQLGGVVYVLLCELFLGADLGERLRSFHTALVRGLCATGFVQLHWLQEELRIPLVVGAAIQLQMAKLRRRTATAQNPEGQPWAWKARAVQGLAVLAVWGILVHAMVQFEEQAVVPRAAKEMRAGQAAGATNVMLKHTGLRTGEPAAMAWMGATALARTLPLEQVRLVVATMYCDVDLMIGALIQAGMVRDRPAARGEATAAAREMACGYERRWLRRIIPSTSNTNSINFHSHPNPWLDPLLDAEETLAGMVSAWSEVDAQLDAVHTAARDVFQALARLPHAAPSLLDNAFRMPCHASSSSSSSSINAWLAFRCTFHPRPLLPDTTLTAAHAWIWHPHPRSTHNLRSGLRNLRRATDDALPMLNATLTTALRPPASLSALLLDSTLEPLPALAAGSVQEEERLLGLSLQFNVLLAELRDKVQRVHEHHAQPLNDFLQGFVGRRSSNDRQAGIARTMAEWMRDGGEGEGEGPATLLVEQDWQEHSDEEHHHHHHHQGKTTTMPHLLGWLRVERCTGPGKNALAKALDHVAWRTKAVKLLPPPKKPSWKD